jgi:hypothetical protein
MQCVISAVATAINCSCGGENSAREKWSGAMWTALRFVVSRRASSLLLDEDDDDDDDDECVDGRILTNMTAAIWFGANSDADSCRELWPKSLCS